MFYNHIKKLASAVHNNILSGLAGFHTNFSISMELLEDIIVNERLSLIKQYSLKGLANPKDLYISINCIPIDCKSIEKCMCGTSSDCDTNTAHFEIPQIITDLGDSSIEYIGATDKNLPFVWYTSIQSLRNHKYRKRGKNRPYVWIDTTPNENGMYDCFVFNAPLLSQVSIIAAFKDIRQLTKYGCCNEDNTKSSLDTEIIDNVSKKMITYYRQLYMSPMPNNQTYTPA